MSKRKHKKFDPMAAIEANETLRRLNPQLDRKSIVEVFHKHFSQARAEVVLAERFSQDGGKVPLLKENVPQGSKSLSFTIPGQPVGKPRQTRSDVWKKRPCVMKYRAWADKARASVPTGTILSIYREIHFIAYLEFPKSYSKTRRALLLGSPHFEKPDCDNILKSFDSLFPEDKFIWKISGEKRWDDSKGPRVEVELR